MHKVVALDPGRPRPAARRARALRGGVPGLVLPEPPRDQRPAGGDVLGRPSAATAWLYVAHDHPGLRGRVLACCGGSAGAAGEALLERRFGARARGAHARALQPLGRAGPGRARDAAAAHAVQGLRARRPASSGCPAAASSLTLLVARGLRYAFWALMGAPVRRRGPGHAAAASTPGSPTGLGRWRPRPGALASSLPVRWASAPAARRAGRRSGLRRSRLLSSMPGEEALAR